MSIPNVDFSNQRVNTSNAAHLEAMKILNGGDYITGGGLAMDFGFRRSTAEQWLNAGMLTTADAEDDDGIMLLGDRVLLTDYAKAANGGVMPPFNWQLTGSCVNGGGQNAIITRIGVEFCLLPQTERFALPFTLMAYGQSRWDAYRDDTEGAGSSGAVFAKALGAGLLLPVDYPGLPPVSICGPALVYSAATEMKYSAVHNHPPALRAAAKEFTLRYREVTDSASAVDQLRRGRPLTFAGDWGGMDRPPVKGGAFPVLLNPHAGVWNHQQSVLGFWIHPSLGLIFLVLNQWYYVDPDGTLKVRYVRSGRGMSIAEVLTPGNALSVHGPIPKLPDGQELPAGSYWILAKDMDYQCRTGEVRSLYSMAGFNGLVAPRA